jgi:Arc/MetJ-type ribon-helix-helix transcriptional regulator
LVDKFGDKYNFKELGALPKEYLEKIDKAIPDDLRKLLSDVIRTLLTKANLPKDEIENLSEQIYERRLPEMFEPHIKYDIP